MMGIQCSRPLMVVVAICFVATSAVVATDASGQQAANWRVGEMPTLRIGSVDGPPHTRFASIQTALLSGGHVIVADQGSSEVRVFGPDGKFLRALGGKGGGPGEFVDLAKAAPYRADSVFAFDFQSSRVTVFGPQGDLGRTFTLRPPPSSEGRGEPVGWLDDGTWLASINSARPAVSAVTRSTLELWHYDANGSPQERIGTYPGRESARSAQGDMAMDLILPWGRRTYIDHRDSTTVVGDGGSGRVSVQRGATKTEFGISAEPQPFGDTTLDAYVDDLVARIGRPEERPMLERMFRGLALPEVLPWFDRVLVDTEGLIWIRRFDVPGSAGETWRVFDASGEPVATVRPPAGFEISDVGTDVVLGITKDELDVEYLEVRTLQRD